MAFRCRWDGSKTSANRLGDYYEVLGPLREGDHFGETGIVLGQPRAATVVAVEFSELYSLSRYDLVNVYQKWPELYREFQEFGEYFWLLPAKPASLLVRRASRSGCFVSCPGLFGPLPTTHEMGR
jgi:CRP-like cAMP-binding protein